MKARMVRLEYELNLKNQQIEFIMDEKRKTIPSVDMSKLMEDNHHGLYFERQRVHKNYSRISLSDYQTINQFLQLLLFLVHALVFVLLHV